ncbi:L-seryl-tRNA(Sec) selenium transferase [Thermosulfurimonas marina]|uniref:L-seryl-tRNA(Sec) selenium transferase n=1 Tax=Thermosulfurimonas marina TaxID=2047767 RepID=A0A6H1WSG8_9BACT|nr:L-seryl-tRNA(Sec) selenium transferase [Thermosulfurimonas marina]QJA06118.1 L-seryl-tRNA(Sec) selenium transferase [Thermosulfurimonas marina]
MAEKEKLLSQIPAVHRLREELSRKHPGLPEVFYLRAARRTTEILRQEILEGHLRGLSPEEVFSRAEEILSEEARPHLRPVINATGVVVHTNLGRSPLAEEALEEILSVARRYSNLEYRLSEGRRGSRYEHVRDLLRELTGAEEALVVNNNAAAVLITLNTLARGKEVVVSRGELVEIGGSFRMPEVMAWAGCRLREVGTTNRTHLRDYEEAISEETALLMKVHRSNFAIVGFTKEVSGAELVRLARRHGLFVVEDLGSGCLVDFARYGLRREPTVQEVVASGVDVVTFSGDKLLGGPQAGIIVGRAELVERIRANPLNRALRIDKLTLAGLEATLRLYLDEKIAVERIPTLKMILMTPEEVKRRARRLTRLLQKALPERARFSVVPTVGRTGGGALPLADLPSFAVAVEVEGLSPEELHERLRTGEPPVVGRIEEDRFLLEVRTIFEEEFPLVAKALKRVVEGAGA